MVTFSALPYPIIFSVSVVWDEIIPIMFIVLDYIIISFEEIPIYSLTIGNEKCFVWGDCWGNIRKDPFKLPAKGYGVILFCRSHRVERIDTLTCVSVLASVLTSSRISAINYGITYTICLPINTVCSLCLSSIIWTLFSPHFKDETLQIDIRELIDVHFVPN